MTIDANQQETTGAHAHEAAQEKRQDLRCMRVVTGVHPVMQNAGQPLNRCKGVDFDAACAAPSTIAEGACFQCLQPNVVMPLMCKVE